MEHDPWWFALHLITIEMDFKTTDPSPGWWSSSTQEAEAVRSLQIWGLLSKALSQNHPPKNRNQNQKEPYRFISRERKWTNTQPRFWTKQKHLSACVGRHSSFCSRVAESFIHDCTRHLPANQLFLSCVCLVRINLWMASSPSACSRWGTGRLRFWMSYPRSWSWYWWW